MLKSSEGKPCLICNLMKNTNYIIIPCGHSGICKDCLEKMKNKAEDENVSKRELGKCPICGNAVQNYAEYSDSIRYIDSKKD